MVGSREIGLPMKDKHLPGVLEQVTTVPAQLQGRRIDKGFERRTHRALGHYGPVEEPVLHAAGHRQNRTILDNDGAALNQGIFFQIKPHAPLLAELGYAHPDRITRLDLVGKFLHIG